MTSLTIHKIDASLEKLIRSRSKADGLSLNRTIKKLLEEALGVRPIDKARYRGDFEEFCGTWTKAEAAAFDKAVADCEQIDEEEWK